MEEATFQQNQVKLLKLLSLLVMTAILSVGFYTFNRLNTRISNLETGMRGKDKTIQSLETKVKTLGETSKPIPVPSPIYASGQWVTLCLITNPNILHPVDQPAPIFIYIPDKEKCPDKSESLVVWTRN